MQSTNFEESNIKFGPPDGMTEDEVRTIFAYRGTVNDGMPVVITCWKPTQEQIDEIQRTGKVWLYVCGESMPPVNIESKNPFE